HERALRLIARAAIPQPERSLETLRLRDRTAIERQIDQCRLRVDANPLGPGGELKGSRDSMLAAGEVELRNPFTRHEIGVLAVHEYVRWPVFQVAGDLDPRRLRYLPTLGEGTAVGIQNQAQPPRPGAPEGAPDRGGGARQKRTLTEGLILEHPGLPGLEVAWNVDRTAHRRGGGEQTQPAQSATKSAANHEAHPLRCSAGSSCRAGVRPVWG